MARFTQDKRFLTIETPLGKDVLLLSDFTGKESISGLSEFHLNLRSEDDSIKAKAVVGSNITFAIRREAGLRYFNGFVAAFAYRGSDERLSSYSAVVVPWLWFLTKGSNCKVYQNKSAKAIIEGIFADYGFSDFDTSEITGTHPDLEYCVQHQETDFAFISRLMEEEGIFYFFRHENGKHTLVLADSKTVHNDCEEKEVTFARPQGAALPSDAIMGWEHRYEYITGRFSQGDYNFETPGSSLVADASSTVDIPGIDRHERYEYPGRYGKKGDGEKKARLRVEEIEVAHEQVHASSRCMTFTPGGKFTLKKHYAKAEGGKAYVITEIEHQGTQKGSFGTGGGQPEQGYTNRFLCIPASVSFRPRRRTPKPVMLGPQTARVVGPAGDEIHTDKYGRVRVQFFWDRYGKGDENSSCWIRVAQSLAGKQWGALHIPRVGQEVVVSFIDGDVDRPLVTGSVYNGEQMPPCALPANGTMTSLKSCSSKGGGGFNEIRFEDKKGDEQIFIHAEKNQDVRIKNDVYEWVGNERHLIVKKNQIDHIENNREATIDNDHIEEVGRDYNLKVGGKGAIEIGGSLSLSVQADMMEAFKANHSEQTTGTYYLKGMGVVIEAMQGLTLKVGGNSVVLDPSGVTIKGSMVTIDGAMTKINSGPGSPPASGQAGSIVAPATPKQAQEADKADPAEASQVKAEQQQTKTGKYGATPVPVFKPTQANNGDSPKSWVEVELVDEAGNPVPGEKYRITLEDGSGSVVEGTLDEKGLARVEGLDPGSVKVTFPNLDKDAWSK